MQMGFRPNRS